MKKKSLVLIIFIIAIFSFTNFSVEKNNIVNAKSSQTIEKNKPAEELKKKENIVFLGDSITEIYPINKIYGDLPIIKSGVSGYKTEDILKRMDSMVYRYNPTKVILLIGTNDISKDISEENLNKTQKNIEKIINGIKKNRKNAKIYIESIYPVNRNMKIEMVSERTNEAIKQLNKKIKKYCKEENITYINMYDELLDSDGNFDSELTYDGLHPSSLGYAKITRILLPYIYEGYKMK